MIRSGSELGVAFVAPEGPYSQGEFQDAVALALASCAGARARGMILDFSLATGIEHHDVVRVRETTRHLTALSDRYSRRLAYIAATEAITHVLEVGGVIRRGGDISYRYCRDRDEAMQWINEEAASASTARP